MAAALKRNIVRALGGSGGGSGGMPHTSQEAMDRDIVAMAEDVATSPSPKDALMGHLVSTITVGRGVEAVVFMAVTRSGAKVAIKTRRRDERTANDAGTADSVEATAMAHAQRLLRESPCVPALYCSFVSDVNMEGHPNSPSRFMVTEWCDGENLSAFASHNPREASSRLFQKCLLLQLLHFLDHLQATLRATHYDPHDQNIFVARSGQEGRPIVLTASDGSRRFALPDIGCIFKVADWSFAYAQGLFERSDLADPECDARAGGIAPAFREDYDVIVLGSFLQIMAIEKRPAFALDPEVDTFVRESMLRGKLDGLLRNSGRPGPNDPPFEGVSPRALLQSPFFDEFALRQ